jgi:hypothetical protein
MLKALPLRDTRGPLLKLSRLLLKRGQIAVPTLFGLILGKLMASPAHDFTVSLTGIAIYFIAIVADPLSGLLLWTITYPFTERTVNISLGSFIPDLSPTRFCIAFLTAMLLAQTATGQRRFPRLRGADIAALLLVVGMGLSAPAAAEPLRAMQMVFDVHLIPVLAYFLAKNLVLGKRDLDRLFNVFLIIGAYTGVYAIYEQLTGNILFIEVEPWVATTRRYSENIRILTGLYGDDNAFGLILGLTLPIAFHRLIKAPTLGKKILYTILAGTMLVGEFCTFKRAAWVSLIAGLLILQFAYPEFRRIFLVLVILFAAAFFLAGDRLAESEVADRATENLDTFNGRLERWTIAIELWKEKPLTGHGYKRFDNLASMKAVESYYLHILVSAGLIGFLPLVTFILLILKDSVAIFRQAPGNPRLFVSQKVIAIFWGMLVVYLAISSSNYMAVAFNHIIPYVLMGAIVGSQSALLERRR